MSTWAPLRLPGARQRNGWALKQGLLKLRQSRKGFTAGAFLVKVAVLMSTFEINKPVVSFAEMHWAGWLSLVFAAVDVLSSTAVFCRGNFDVVWIREQFAVRILHSLTSNHISILVFKLRSIHR